MWEVIWRRGQNCYILTPSSSDHSSTSFAFWLGCSTMSHWGPKPSRLELVLTPASCLQLTHCPKPSVAPGYIIVSCPPASCMRTHTEFNHVYRSRWYSGYTCFTVLLLIYTSASLDWWLGQGSIWWLGQGLWILSLLHILQLSDFYSTQGYEMGRFITWYISNVLPPSNNGMDTNTNNFFIF